MFLKLLNRLLGRSTARPGSAAEQIVQQVPGNLPDAIIPEDRILCIFQQGRLVNYYRDENPPERRSGESWWLIPDHDLVLKITLEVGNATCAIDVSVRFEPEGELLALLDSQEYLTRDDLVSLVTSQLAGLVEMLGYTETGPLVESEPGKQERLRARLSLVLQNHGLRCTDLSNWELAEDAATESEDESAQATEATPADDEESTAELMATVEQVDQAEKWDGLMATLETSGCQFDQQAAEELNKLGEQVVDRTIRAEKATRRIQELSRQARQRARIPRPELQRWRGLDIRLQSNMPAESADEPTNSDLEVVRKRRPWTWWMLSRRSVDGRLLQYLHRALSDLRRQFDEYRSDKSLGQGLVQLRRIDQRLAMALDLLETVPTLHPQQSSLRIERTKIKPLVRYVEGAVTAVETVQAETRSLRKKSVADDDWIQSCEAICEALEHLDNQLQQRRHVRTSLET